MEKEYNLLPPISPNERGSVICRGCNERKEHSSKGYCYRCYKRLVWPRKKIICKNCKRLRYHQAFGLCGGCHMRLHHYSKVLKYNARKYNNLSLEIYGELTKQCGSCGFTNIVQLHHLDGDHKNNEKNNLVGLCPNCHKSIHTYKYCEEIKENLRNKGYNVSKVHPTNFIKK